MDRLPPFHLSTFLMILIETCLPKFNCVYVCLSERERDRQRQRERQTDRELEREKYEREREKDRDRERERERGGERLDELTG